MKAKWFGTLLILALLVIAVVPAASAAPKASDGAYDDPTLAQAEDNLPDPFTTKQLELKQQALEAKLNGKAYGKIHEVARGQYVELELDREGAVWTVLGEFSDLKHNQIPAPDRAVDNSTLWVPDFSKEHFDQLLYDDTPGA